MGTPYTRQSTLTDGDTITAALFNDEYNQLLSSFSYASSGTTGHQHDGTAGEGGNIAQIGDADFLNKIVVDSANNRWGFFVQVSSSAVEQIRVQDGAIVPVTNNDIDLGTSSLQFKDAYFDGTVEADAITINGTSLAETISDTVGAMVSSNTETNITVSYDDSDNTLDFVIGTLNQDTTGNAATATTLATARTIGGTSFNGSANIAVALANTATTLATARTIGGTSFDGSANIGVALANTATTLATARTIGGTSFDGSANIAVALSATATTLATARTIHGVSFNGSANIDLAEVICDTVGAMFSSNTETGITATYQDGDNTIDLVVSDSSDTTGNAATATVLETARTIGGTSFNGSANIAVALAATATTLATARTIHGVSFNGSANIDLSEVISDTVGAMFSSNTETGIAATYQDGDNTIDLVIGNDVIVQSMIADDAIDSQHYVDGSIDTAHIADDQITAAKIADNAIVAAGIADNAVVAAGIADNAVDIARLNVTDGDDGEALVTDGNGTLSFAAVGGLYNDWAIKTSAYTLVSGDQIIVNASGATTITLPASSAAGATVTIKATGGGTVTIGRNSQKINSVAGDGTLQSGKATQLVFVNSTIGFLEI